jgi:hypothetical protein
MTPEQVILFKFLGTEQIAYKLNGGLSRREKLLECVDRHNLPVRVIVYKGVVYLINRDILEQEKENLGTQKA